MNNKISFNWIKQINLILLFYLIENRGQVVFPQPKIWYYLIMHSIKPLKRLGQNFLIDKNVIKKVIRTAELKPADVVLEIGPGIGALTQEIAKSAGKVIAVEKDPRLVERLKKDLKEFKNIKIVQGDILKFQIPNSKLQTNSKFQIQNYKIVANLPFYITAPVIRKFLESKHPPKEMILIVQKEVAQRICAKPPNMSILALSVQFFAKPKIVSYVSNKSFWPKPKVDSAIIKIVPERKYKVNKKLFFKIVKAGFSHPRKQLANNLSKELKLNKKEVNDLLLKNNIKPSQRAETLFINDWIKLFNMLK